MSDLKGLRLKPPSPLPQGPISKVAFKVFVNQLKAYLEQDYSNYMFLQGGSYQEWGPEQEGRRIRNLAADDPENQKLLEQAAAGREPRVDLPAEQNRLLLTRNSQLSKFITLIAILCYYTEQDDIVQCSTSMEWILTYLRQHYNLENRGEHFLDIVEVAYTQDLPYQTFYKQFRAGFLDNLRKRGDRLMYKNNTQLDADEIMSPTLEATIVLWALERIDPRLPKKVKKNYGHQMVGDQCLVSLQPTIFQNIGNMLTELEEAEIASSARCEVTQAACNFLTAHDRKRTNSQFTRGRRQRSRGSGSNSRWSKSSKKLFCRICYHAGAAPAAYLSHSISTCSYLSKADRADLGAIETPQVEEPNFTQARQYVYNAPGWDVEEEQIESESEESDINVASLSINDHSYEKSTIKPQHFAQTNALTLPEINHITPIPSQVIVTQSEKGVLPITIDSGATLSFIRLALVNELQLPMQSNNQLATLADQQTLITAVGEIDINVTFNGMPLKLCALVVANLQAPCFGGTNFLMDNRIATDIADQKVIVNGRCFRQSNFRDNLTYLHPDSKIGVKDEYVSRCMLVKTRTTVLPGSTLPIPLDQTSAQSVVAITPSFVGVDPQSWPAQICPVIEGCAHYLNSLSSTITCPKHSHFTAHPVEEKLGVSSCVLSNASSLRIPPVSTESILNKMQINKNLLSVNQVTKLEQIHRENIAVFDNDLTKGYNHHMGHYTVSFAFKNTSSPPPLKVWAPQYNRSCQELLQAKCDQLEAQGVLVDPAKEHIDVLHLSPIMIQQKGNAKHKKLQDCSLDEIRFISCQNVLNDSIKPIPSNSTSQVKILKFLARWRYHIYADLHNSYFQIPINRNLWGYMAVNTPYRGIKILTRAGQGLLNSDVHLEQLLCKILGDEITCGIVEVARDDIQVGANSIDELLDNWSKILRKLAACNLKLSPHKVRILLDDVEVYGVRVTNGHVSPSPHKVTDLGNVKLEEIKTIKQLNSWRGLYKTLIGHLPHLSHFMEPFDKFAASKKSSDQFTWTPELKLAFKNAVAHLSEINKTFLPSPEDQLILKPDTAKVKTCTGWVLYALKRSAGHKTLLPVHYCTAKLPDYMAKWYPCELEAVGAVLAIDQVAHWINESRHQTIVMPDSMPVVKAANLMKQGKHSKNPRLQSLLACVNRRNVVFVHNSAKKGDHVVPDTLSRLNRTCSCGDCSVNRFLQEIPVHAELMSVDQVKGSISSITNIIWSNCAKEVNSVMANTINTALQADTGSIPFGNKKVWKSLQLADPDCKTAIDLITTGNVLPRKSKNRIINKLLRDCIVSKRGLLVHRSFNSRTLTENDRIVVPQTYLYSILCILHTKLLHPTSHQLAAIFEKYFYAPNLLKNVEQVKEKCDTCISVSKLPRDLQYMEPNKMPQHPGSHMNIDILQRSKQKIIVCADMFSSFTTAAFVTGETREILEQAIIQVVTPIRHSPTLTIRTDNAPAFKSLSTNSSSVLKENGINLQLGDDANKNSNAVVDKLIQELEMELKKISPDGQQIPTSKLGHALTILNSRIRAQGLSAAELHFSRDPIRGVNLHLNDADIARSKISARERANRQKSSPRIQDKQHSINPGDTVVITRDGTKHEARAPHLVTDTKGEKITVTKITNSSQFQPKQPGWSPHQKIIHRKFLTIKTKSPGTTSLDDIPPEPPINNPLAPAPWYPTIQIDDSSSDEFSDYEIDPPCIYYNTSQKPSCSTLDDGSKVQPPNAQTPEQPDTNPPDLNQTRLLKKKDRVTFFNERTNRWTTATITSGPNKYYKRHGNYHNFVDDNGTQGGHYFNPDGRWSLLSEDQITDPDTTEDNLIPDPLHNLDIEMNQFYIDDEYHDQMDLSITSSHSPTSDAEILTFYPSAASFPDLDLGLQQPISYRTRFISSSEPDLPTYSCHQALRQRIRRWGSSLRDVWKSNDNMECSEDEDFAN